jgi:formylglycine-generating enzyme required for sulfatase activity
MRNIQVSVRISPALYEKLLAEAQALNVPKSEILLTALTQYFNKTEAIFDDSRLAQLEKRVAFLETQSRQVQAILSPSEIALPSLQECEFELVDVDRKGEIIKRVNAIAQYFSESLSSEVSLTMVAIPGGTFLMGAPQAEKGSQESEKPQHLVTITPFFLSQFPVTQAQWQAVANLAKIRRDLNPDPAYFKGDDRPVERVSWYDAIEFCERLSRQTNRCYRLPSEAEWEYACRGGTIKPFYFGETITGELANYIAKKIYCEESSQLDRQETTNAGSFPPNAFGLYDMHGNVWEWCSDRWHDNYENAPNDGSAWLSENEREPRVLRGGGWDFYPEHCRSASRFSFPPTATQINQIGLRVVCDPKL